MDETEVEICVPWGQVTCKVFTKPGTRLIKTTDIVIFIHDINDNAASFDQLIENLKENRLYIAMDLPGHGKSSSAHSHALYHLADYVLSIKYVIYKVLHQFNPNESIKQIVLVAHGKSTHIGAIFTQMYPKLISKLILLDDLYDYGITAKDFATSFRKIIDNYYFIENQLQTKTPEEFSFKEIFNNYKDKYNVSQIKCVDEVMGDIGDIETESLKTVKALTERSSRRIDNGKYLLRNDLHLKNLVLFTSGYNYMIDFLRKRPIICPVMIMCTQVKTTQHKEFITVLQSKNKNVQMIRSPFDNYHIMKPADTGDVINHFLNFNHDSKL